MEDQTFPAYDDFTNYPSEVFSYDLDGQPSIFQQPLDSNPNQWITDPNASSQQYLLLGNTIYDENFNFGLAPQTEFPALDPWPSHEAMIIDQFIQDFDACSSMDQSTSQQHEFQFSPALSEQQLPSSSTSVSGTSSLPMTGLDSDAMFASPAGKRYPAYIQDEQAYIQHSSFDINDLQTMLNDPTSSLTVESAAESQQQAQEEKPQAQQDYTCRHCPRTFTKNHLRTKHEQTHLKPITCPQPHCPHRTAMNRDMRRHIIVHHPRSNHNTHTHPSPATTSVGSTAQAENGMGMDFKCEVRSCGRAFNRKDNLVRHVRKMHGFGRMIP